MRRLHAFKRRRRSKGEGNGKEEEWKGEREIGKKQTSVHNFESSFGAYYLYCSVTRRLIWWVTSSSHLEKYAQNHGECDLLSTPTNHGIQDTQTIE